MCDTTSILTGKSKQEENAKKFIALIINIFGKSTAEGMVSLYTNILQAQPKKILFPKFIMIYIPS